MPDQVLGLDLTRSAVLSVLPWITMAISSNFGGYLADKAIAGGASVTTVRKVRPPAHSLRRSNGVQWMQSLQGCW